MEQNNNTVDGDLAGRDITKNIYYQEVPDLEAYLKQITDIVNNKLPKGVYNYLYKSPVEFDAEFLFDSLVQITIPSKVALAIIKAIPNHLDSIENLEQFSTRDIRTVVYKELQKLDYSKFGENVDYWGQNYIRKYGNPDIEMQVIEDDKSIFKPLNKDFLIDTIIPDI